MRLKFELTNHDSADLKNFTVLTSMNVNRKGIEIGQFFSLEMELNIHQKGFTIPNPYQIAKSEKYETLRVSKLLIWLQEWVSGNSLVVKFVDSSQVRY